MAGHYLKVELKLDNITDAINFLTWLDQLKPATYAARVTTVNITSFIEEERWLSFKEEFLQLTSMPVNIHSHRF